MKLLSNSVSVLRSSSRRILVLGAALTLGVVASTQAGRRILRTHGEITGRRPIRTKREVASTLSFNPGHVTINSGETLTFEHGDKTQDPHTLTIVNKADLPASSAEVFNCGAPGTVCDDIFQLLPGEPSGPEFLNVAGGSGLDARGDTMFILPGTSVSATVTAAPGSTLYFLCLIHPWMQVTIKVH